MSKFSKKGIILSNWNRLYLRATDLDRWNQIYEAADEYERCMENIQSDTTCYGTLFTSNQMKLLEMTCACLRVRAKTLRNRNQCEPLTLGDLEKLRPMMKNFNLWKAPFPVMLQYGQYSDDRSSASSKMSSIEGSDEELLANKNYYGHPLLPRLPYSPGHCRLTLKIQNIGIKDAQSLIHPFLSVSVKDSVGLCITEDQDLCHPIKIEDNCIHFEQDVEIQKYMDKLYKGTAIYFELKHYKKHKRLLSTKCYTFLEPKEIRSGPTSMQLLKKPVEYSRRNLNFLTKKPLYLNIFVTVHDQVR